VHEAQAHLDLAAIERNHETYANLGTVLMRQGIPYDSPKALAICGAITAIPGAVFSAGGDGGIRAYSSKDGAIIWTFDTNRPFQTVNGVAANGGSMDATGPVVVGGMLYVNSGYNSFVGRAGNVLLAFRVE